ncbi:restriction endonuclease subunit S, partial [Brachyspira intermedia]|uniref:restriction endonuclease subunit S n=1 Tax=Brachyspira intermedia TaxID=84377 RepID=UPI003007A4B7
NLSFYFPPLEEQKRIAEVLSLCDEVIENLTELIEKKEQYKKGVMQRLLSGEVRFKEFTDEWQKYKLLDIGISYSGLTNKNASNFIDNCNAKYVTYKSIYDSNKIDINRLEDVFVEKDEKQNLVQYGDAFFTISSETPDEVAISSVLLDKVDNTYLNSFCFGFRFDFNILLPEFARYYFRSNYIRKYTYKLSQGSTRFNLSKNKFLEMIINIPSIEEQKKIAGLLSVIDEEIENLKKQLELRKQQKKGLM